MTERLPGKFLCSFLLECSPLYPGLLPSQVLEGVLPSDFVLVPREQASAVMCASWSHTCCAFISQMAPFMFSDNVVFCPKVLSPTPKNGLVPAGHICTYLYILVGAATRIAQGFGILNKTFVTALLEVFWPVSEVSRLHHSLCRDHGPKINLIIANNVPPLK